MIMNDQVRSGDPHYILSALHLREFQEAYTQHHRHCVTVNDRLATPKARRHAA
jgi:hypothetical protein